MRKLLSFSLILFPVSCSAKKCDCSECEEELEFFKTGYITPLDLPEEKPQSKNSDKSYLTVVVLENNKYVFEENEYDFENLLPALENSMNESPVKIKGIRIAGHRFSHYESVFEMLAFCQANELDPIMLYDK